ncbi:MAG: hypothetical protein KC731_35680 [Myxococcales bacterium]|nr:hypothetical protein [Myxococcales bacterium]
MKKATTSLEQFRSQLEAIARDLHRAAKFEVGREDLPELVDVDTLCGTFFSFGDPEPAPMRGRGARLRVPLGWVWWPAEMSPEDGAALAVRRLLSIPGVEDVTRPKLDPQFGLIWQAYVVIRVSQ